MVEAEDVFQYQVEGYNGVAEYADLAVEELENIYMLTLEDEVVLHKGFVFADI